MPQINFSKMPTLLNGLVCCYSSQTGLGPIAPVINSLEKILCTATVCTAWVCMAWACAARARVVWVWAAWAWTEWVCTAWTCPTWGCIKRDFSLVVKMLISDAHWRNYATLSYYIKYMSLEHFFFGWLKNRAKLIRAWSSADTTFKENLSTNTTQTPVTALETLPLIKMCTNATDTT